VVECIFDWDLMLNKAMLPRAAHRVHQMAVPSRWGGGQVLVYSTSILSLDYSE